MAGFIDENDYIRYAIKMKFVIIGPEKYHYTKDTADAMKKLGHNVSVIYYKDFYESSTYFQRKMYKLGFSHLKEQWDDNQERLLIATCRKVSESANELYVLVVSNLELSDKALMCLKEYKKIIYLWDSVKISSNNFITKLKKFDKIYVFEKKDINFLKEKGIETAYLPLGYNEEVFFHKTINKDIDISFIGMPDDERLHTVECLAEYVTKNELTLRIYGEWYDKRHFWRKYKYSRRHPYLYKFIENRMVSAEESAEIYNRSKICMNINRKIHKSINPRTFEIMAARTCMFMNAGVDVEGILVPGTDYVEYENDDDLLDKIDYMLKNEEEREGIAWSGCSKILGKYSMQHLCKRVLNDMNIIL